MTTYYHKGMLYLGIAYVHVANINEDKGVIDVHEDYTGGDLVSISIKTGEHHVITEDKFKDMLQNFKYVNYTNDADTSFMVEFDNEDY